MFFLNRSLCLVLTTIQFGLLTIPLKSSLYVSTSRIIKNEVTTDTITVTDINGIIVFEAVVKMDHDLYDTGFVKAVQIDDAPEWEGGS